MYQDGCVKTPAPVQLLGFAAETLCSCRNTLRLTINTLLRTTFRSLILAIFFVSRMLACRMHEFPLLSVTPADPFHCLFSSTPGRRYPDIQGSGNADPIDGHRWETIVCTKLSHLRTFHITFHASTT